MGQIVKRKKKGRPPKSDLPVADDVDPDSGVRRSLRRRNVRYNFLDYDDFIDDEEFRFDGEEEDEEEDEDERRREKKVKLVVKLNQGAAAARGPHAPGSVSDEGSDDDEEEERGRRVVKKRRISGRGRGRGRVAAEELDDEEEENEARRGDADDDEESGLVKGDTRKDLYSPSPPGTPPEALSSVPLPDKKKLELILDKLQKKDTYGVYAEPVDPDELPDYHEVIEHPMDFSTVRKKLANGIYTTLELLESDVFLICSNAMQYNAPDTVYYKQARTIQELGRKKFQKLRIDYERSEQQRKLEEMTKNDFNSSEKELKSDQMMKSSVPLKKHIKKPATQLLQEPVGSDFSAGANVGIGGDLQNVPVADQGGHCGKPSINDGVLESSPCLAESNMDRAEEQSTGKGLSAKFWRKSSTVDENRRATYNKSDQPVVRADSIFTTFESELKQLVAVGLHAENSYARSLARFSATLGPIAWKVASERIEQALPSGSKFGRGWVGEYEPLPTPILLLDKRLSQGSLMANSLRNIDSRKDFKAPAPPGDPVNRKAVKAKAAPILQNNVPLAGNHVFRPNITGTADQISAVISQSPVSRNPVGTGSKVRKQFELNSLPPTSHCNGDSVAEKKHMDNADKGVLRPGEINRKSNHPRREALVPETIASQSKETVATSISSPRSIPLKQPDASNLIGRGLANGKILNDESGNGRLSSSSGGPQNEMQRAPGFFFRQDQGLSDPVQLMRMLAEKAQKQQSPRNHSGDNSTPTVVHPVPSLRGDTTGNAASAAASVWMSIGGGGFKQATEKSASPRDHIPVSTDSSSYNSPRDLHHQSQMTRTRGEFPSPSGGTYFQRDRGSSPLPPPFLQQPSPVRFPNEAPFSNRPMVFPQLTNPNMSRFQGQQHWRGIAPQNQQRPRQETLPPDLNIGFQSPGSPVRQSSGVKMDSQQPDLALQL